MPRHRTSDINPKLYRLKILASGQFEREINTVFIFCLEGQISKHSTLIKAMATNPKVVNFAGINTASVVIQCHFDELNANSTGRLFSPTGLSRRI